MTVKEVLARVFFVFERAVDRVRSARDAACPFVDHYGGFSTPDGVVVRGRVLSRKRGLDSHRHQRRWRNAKGFIELFLTDELSDIVVRVADTNAQTKTDEEGFFTLLVETTTRNEPTEVAITVGGSAHTLDIPVFTSKGRAFGVISDIDDTVMHTGAFSLIQNLWTSMTGNVHTRQVFPDAVEMLNGFARQDACFFYVSSSPWNLHIYLSAIFQRSNVPAGPHVS
ncbi:hypothetical protein A8B78_12015 [Jannaschia sp. EhC01]|nr:hypothetical protein A8B78_12015 [Jannaschia sp. EhC01]